MNIHCSVYIATSLDGYIAREDGNIDWLNEASASTPEGEDYGYAKFMSTVDALVMGRNTYEQMVQLDTWFYGNKHIFVLSSKSVKIPDHLKATVFHASGTPKDICDSLEKQGYKHLYIDGGVTVQRFLDAGLINDMIITIIPILLGNGISLFGNSQKDIPLQLIKTQSFDSGFAQLTYKI